MAKKKFKVKVGAKGNVTVKSKKFVAGGKKRVMKVTVKNKELSELGGRPMHGSKELSELGGRPL